MSLGTLGSNPNDHMILGTYVIDSENFCANGGHF
jgi:hypothetical protein